MANLSTRIKRHVNAPRAKVYNALLDAHAVATLRSLTRTTARMSSPYTTTFRLASRRRTTKPGGEWHSTNSWPSSKQARIVRNRETTSLTWNFL